jgi:hypothetical protein
MIRDEVGAWIPAAFLLHGDQSSDTLAIGLKQIRKWCGNRRLLRYMLTDDSAGEQSAVKKGFPGLKAGEQKVDHLLCSVHSERTLCITTI